MINLPDDIRFVSLLEKRFGTVPYGKLQLEIQSRLTEAEKTPVCSALSAWSLRVPEIQGSYKMWGWYLGLLIILPDYDYYKSIALNRLLNQALRRYEPGNQYEIFLKFIDYFHQEEAIKTRSPYNFSEVLEFLILELGRDPVYGNLVNLVGRFTKRQLNTAYSFKRVRFRNPTVPQRKRGYTDKGSLPPDYPIEPPVAPYTETQRTKDFYRKKKETGFDPETYLWLDPSQDWC